jgi:hypothetical protein
MRGLPPEPVYTLLDKTSAVIECFSPNAWDAASADCQRLMLTARNE